MKLPEFVTPKSDVIFSEAQDEIFLLRIDEEHYYGLSAVGKRFWEEIGKEPSVDRAVDVLLSEFAVQEDTLRADLGELCEDLVAHRLVEASSSKSGAN